MKFSNYFRLSLLLLLLQLIMQKILSSARHLQLRQKYIEW